MSEPFISVAGVVGKAPTMKPTPKGEVLEFSLAVRQGYGDDSETIWYDVSVWNEGLQASVKAAVYRGAKVAVTGKLSVRESNGRNYPKISAGQVGLVEWLRREQAPAPAQKPAAKAEPKDELDF